MKSVKMVLTIFLTAGKHAGVCRKNCNFAPYLESWNI
jgi:hypothetical protein